jgi:hypothetical protein
METGWPALAGAYAKRRFRPLRHGVKSSLGYAGAERMCLHGKWLAGGFYTFFALPYSIFMKARMFCGFLAELGQKT